MAPRVGSKKNTKSKTTEVAAGPKVALPPGGPGSPIEIVFSFDTTGSMSSCINEVKTKVQEIIKRLFADIPNLRIGVFAHGDYCDAHNYVTKYVDLCQDQNKLCDFVQKVTSTGGGDWEECYELVLRQAREEISWQPGTQRSLVMIGDAPPHEPSYSLNKLKIDWKEEVQDLKNLLDMRIYSVQCGGGSTGKAADFFKHISEKTGGKLLQLQKFESIVEFIMAICYREHGAEFYEAYEKEYRDRVHGDVSTEMGRMLDTLRDGDATDPSTPVPSTPTSDSWTPVTLPKAKPSKPIKKMANCALVAGVKRRLFAKKAVKKSAVDRKSTKKIAQQLREDMSELGSNLAWSEWKLAIVHRAPKQDGWRKRADHGYSRTDLFKDTRTEPTVYEVAVQKKAHCRRHAVFMKATKGFAAKRVDTFLLRNKQGQMENVMKKGCRIFVRRAPVTKTTKVEGQKVNSVVELRNLMKKTYDYAWLANRGKGRKVEKCGIEISKYES